MDDAQIHERLKELGVKRKTGVQLAGIEISLCQFIIAILSLLSVVFLVVPIFFLRDTVFLFIFLSISILCTIAGVWFWLKRAEICEHPEQYGK